MAKPSLAPIALFVYNRPEHARRTVASLLANPEARESDLFVFCDGAKDAQAGAPVGETRAFVRRIEGFASVTITESEVNLGLAQSIIRGVSQICGLRGRVIVLEDDLLLSPHFLRYMNDGLDCYAGTLEVASIHGYTYPVDAQLPETFFMRGADCWGWATWARAWQCFEPDAAKLLAALRASGQAGDFDYDGAAGYLKMLEDFSAGRNNSWAVRWHAAAYLRGMLTLYPGRSLVRNIGIDGSGTHSGDVDVFDGGLADRPVAVAPIALHESAPAKAAFGRYFRSLKPSVVQRIGRRVRRSLGLGAVAGR